MSRTNRAAVAFAVAAACLTFASTASADYHVRISGTVSGNDVWRRAILTLYDGPFTQDTTNGINRLEPCLLSGYPAAQAGVGAIWYGSNNGCFPGATGTELDLAFVRVWHYRNGDLKKIVVRPDENIAAAGLNLFTSSDNWIYAIPFYPVQGRAVYRFSHNENRLDGWFDLWGYSGLYWSEYSADIWGHWRDDS